MSKTTKRLPLHVRIDTWIREQCERYLDDSERLMDVHFRNVSGPGGPQGWTVIINKTVLGRSGAYGVTFPDAGRPSKADVVRAFEQFRAAADEAMTKQSLIVKPNEVPKNLRGPQRVRIKGA